MESRITPIIREFKSNPNYNMRLLLSYLSPSEIVPDPNKHYVFIYKAKTPKITYDAHPFILSGNIFKWGFTGFNYHWEEVRQYTWSEVISNIYEIYDNEVDEVQQIPLASFKST